MFGYEVIVRLEQSRERCSDRLATSSSSISFNQGCIGRGPARPKTHGSHTQSAKRQLLDQGIGQGRAGQGRTKQGRTKQGRAAQGRAGKIHYQVGYYWLIDWLVESSNRQIVSNWSSGCRRDGTQHHGRQKPTEATIMEHFGGVIMKALNDQAVDWLPQQSYCGQQPVQRLWNFPTFFFVFLIALLPLLSSPHLQIWPLSW